MTGWRRRADHLAFDVLGAVALILGVYKTAQYSWCWLGWFDEGILLSHTRVLTHGGWPFRDFYTQYPPGIYFLLAGLWRIFGPSVLLGRVLSAIFRLAIAALAGVAGGRLADRRFTLLPAGLVTMWLALLGGPPFAWLAGLLFALAAALALARAATSPRPAQAPGRWMLAGAMLGLTLCFRHDLFVYFCTAAAPAGACFLYRLRPARAELLRMAGALLVGAAGPLAIFWLPTLIEARWSVIYHDLFADQLRYVAPARRLRWPPIVALTAVPRLPVRLPTFLYQVQAGACAVVFIAPLLGVWAWVRARRRALGGATAATLLALAVAVFPQATGRAELSHFLYATTPGLIFAGALAYRSDGAAWWRSALFGVVFVIFCAGALHEEYPPHGPLIPPVDPGTLDGSPLVGRIPDGRAEPRRQLRQLVAATLAPGEPIFVGNQIHTTVLLSETDLYFVLDHPPAVRYLQFDPGILPRRQVQEEMIRDLEKKRPRLAILSDVSQWNEGQTPPGSTALDDYLKAHYRLEQTVGPYQVLRRAEPLATPPPPPPPSLPRHPE
jgi:hypothetical protein